VIRRLESGDAEAYRALRLEALRMSPEAFSSSYDDEAGQDLGFFARRLPNTFGCFVDGVLVGTAGLVVAAGVKMRHRGTIVGVFLSPAYRGRGLARRLMESVIAAARDDGLASVRLAVTVGNVSAERLYGALGFRRYGVEPDAIRVDGVGFDEALMVLDL
jgi:ribosomal protein S18 acetylase RimI-like enzyme